CDRGHHNHVIDFAPTCACLYKEPKNLPAAEFLPYPNKFLIHERLLTTSNSTVDQDESQMEEEAGSPPQAQEKKDEGQIQINASHLNLT
ncbi:unnamed protein product, partial [Fusarium graminearum]